MRPDTIVWFERLYLASLVLAAASLAIARDEMSAIFLSTAAMITLAVTVILTVSLVLLASRKCSKVAKWLLVGLFALGLASLLPGIVVRGEPLDFGWNEWAVWIMQTVATGLLFTPSAREWMRWRRDPAADPDTLERTFE